MAQSCRNPRVVLDTNVLVAAAYNPSSASRLIVESCLAGERTALVSLDIRREAELILKRAVRGSRYVERLRLFLEQATVVEPAQTPRVVPDDPDDDKLVAAALAGDAVLVTNDRHLLEIAPQLKVPVFRPRDFQERTTEAQRAQRKRHRE